MINSIDEIKVPDSKIVQDAQKSYKNTEMN